MKVNNILNTHKLFFLFILFSIMCLSNGIYAQTPDRSKPPVLGLPAALNLPQIKHLKLSNGIPVIYMKKSQVPLVQINVLVKVGSVYDPVNQAGLASLTADMLDEGTVKYGPLELADKISFLGARISTSADFHTTRINLHTPKSKIDSALALLTDIVLNPSFPEKELERLRREKLTTLMQWHDNPMVIASILFNNVVYGKDHPYGRIAMGNEAFLRNIKTSDIKNFYTANFKASNAAIIVVGDVEEKEITNKLEKVFGKWSKGKSSEIKFPDTKQADNLKLYIADKPGSPQSVIYIGHVGVQRKTEDYFSLVILNNILGGSFASRLNQNLRETHGYTYGAHSNFAFRSFPGPFVAYASVQTEVTDSALIEFMKELKNISQPVSDGELDRAKSYISLQFPYEFETVENIAGMLDDLIIYNLPDNYFNNYVNNIMSITKDDVERVSKKYINPGAFSIVIVGDKQKIAENVKKLGLADITFMSIDDVLGKVPEI